MRWHGLQLSPGLIGATESGNPELKTVRDSAMTELKLNMAETTSRVVVFQAGTPVNAGHAISFLLSARQVVEVTENLPIWPVPLAPAFTDGITYWQQRVLPVVSLEKCLGLVEQDATTKAKMLVVRSRDKTKTGNDGLHGIFRIGPNIRHILLPAECQPVNAAEWTLQYRRLRGAYKWQSGILLVPDVEMILNGELYSDMPAGNCLAV